MRTSLKRGREWVSRRGSERCPRRKTSATALEFSRPVCMTTISVKWTYLPLGTNVEVVVESKLQDFCLLGDNFICDLLRQRQNALHAIAKARGHLVILALFFQELNRQTLPLPPVVMPGTRTYLKRDAGNAKDSLRNWVQLVIVNALIVLYGCGIKTSAKTAPYLIALSTAFSIDPLIIGGSSFSSPSSSRSDKRRASAYATLVAGGDGLWQGTNGIICRESYF